MKKTSKVILCILCLFLTLSFCTAGLGCAGNNDKNGQTLSGETLVREQNALVKWEGRYDVTTNESEQTQVNLYHTATGFTVDFVGSSLSVTFNAQVSGNSDKHYPRYNLALDQETLPTVQPERTFYLTGGEQTVTLVKDLEWGRHTVKCLKMSEPYDAVTSVVSITTNGQFVERDTEYDNGCLRFMSVCASGGSGHGALGFSDDGKGSLGRTTLNSSSLHAFCYLTSRIFGADVQFVANSGWGVNYPTGKGIYNVLDYAGITTTNNESGAKTTAKWDYQKWIPNVILFNIGGNDTTANGFDKITYQNKVVDLVEKLHQQYPNAKMIWTHTNSNAGNYAIAALTDAGIMKEGYVAEVIIPKVGADGTVGANGHNSMLTHVTTADIIANALVSKWGFMRAYDNVTIEDYQSVLQNF